MLQWNDLHPYNAVHVVRIGEPLDLGRLKRIIAARVEREGFGSLFINRGGGRFQYEKTPASPELRVLSSGAESSSGFADEIERQLNTPFNSREPFSPFRFFVAPEMESFSLGLVYFHPVADAECILILLKRIVDDYGGSAGQEDSLGFDRYPKRADIAFRGPTLLLKKLADAFSLLRGMRRAYRPHYRDSANFDSKFDFFTVNPETLQSMSKAAKSWSITLNDFFLALMMKAVSALAPNRSRTARRKEIALGCIVNTRKDLGMAGQKIFGLFLGSFVVHHEAPEGIDLADLARDIGQQTRKVKQQQLYLGSGLELALGRIMTSFFPAERRKKLYAKQYPLWGGISNMDLNPLWPQKDQAAPLDYFRAVSTGPVTPLVLSITTFGRVANVGMTYRSTAFSQEQIRRVKGCFLDWKPSCGAKSLPPAKALALAALLLLTVLVAPGCATYKRHGLDPAHAIEIERSYVCRNFSLAEVSAEEILALNPEHVTESDLRGALAHAPAPRIINIHGGIYPVHRRMISFSEFLMGMGYPGTSITNPGDGTYTFSCYESSEKIAGAIAWYYEREGLRPIIVGHSQGGMQTVKVLRKLAGRSAKQIHVWNPLTWKEEETCEIVDPLTGKLRPVVGLQLPYATVTGAGGLTRFLPNQWDMWTTLRKIPDSVEEFTGFCKEKDLLGGDYYGYGSANYFKARGHAVVRNVWLPTEEKHGEIPETRHLCLNPKTVDWINNYQPSKEEIDRPVVNQEFDSNSDHIIWAAEVWHDIKKHWVLELQRKIRITHNSEPHAWTQK
ncbi:MAG TPA: hypothetical protein VFA77_00635 [Candidatus Eisenbacteria bacterium]|nr:hypothetical protein [Candidatus Eisenbacteria bacterium]